MEKKGCLWKIFSLSPLKISLLITVLFLFLFVVKERGQKHLDRGIKDVRFKSLEMIELKAYDIRFQVMNIFMPPKPSDKVVVVEIDDRSAGFWGWPFPRSKWGQFIRRMQEYGAAVVAFDVVFADEGEYAGLQFVQDTMAEYRRLKLDSAPIETDALSGKMTQLKNNVSSAEKDISKSIKSLQNRKARGSEITKLKKARKRLKSAGSVVDELAGLSRPGEDNLPGYLEKASAFGEFIRQKEIEADQDRDFGEALKEVDNVVLGWYYYRAQSEVDAQADKDFSDNAELLAAYIPTIKLSKGWTYKLLIHRLWLVRSLGLQTNIPILSKNSELFGFFTAEPDTIDGTIRKTPMINVFTLDEDNPDSENTFVYPSLSLTAVAKYLGEKPMVKFTDLGAEISVKGKVIPTDKFGRLLINWMGPSYTFKYYSVYDVITGFKDQDPAKPEVDPYKVFKDKIVFVGSTTVGAHDLRVIPFGTCPGVEMHANVASNLLDDDALYKTDFFRFLDVIFIIVVGVVFGIVLPRLSAVWGGIITVVFLLLYLGTNIYFFVYNNYSFTIVFPLAEILLIYIGVTIYRYATEEREKRFIKGAFEHYLSPTVINQLMDDPAKLNLGGERKVLTAFFSDIQSFSTFSERMEPEELVNFLNIYLTEMCDIILDHDGTIDKFEGDAIIAFFGAPIDYPDHAARAALCAAEIQERMVTLREKWKGEGLPEVHMRIGLNTGPMVVGNMGSRDRMDYTMMGDSVNLAARLEGAGKQYNIYSMISEDTKEAVGDLIEVRALDIIQVMGKEEGVKVYELLGRKGEVDPQKMEAARAYEKGLELHWQREWDRAIEQFEKALEIDPEEGPSQVLIARCEEYGENPPGPEWEGVYTMKTK